MNTEQDFQLILTDDGSHTVISKVDQFGYHSSHGAIQESKHIFIQHGLNYFVEHNPTAHKIKILEIGFGTGLNALLTMLEPKATAYSVHYTALETSLLPYSLIQQINYPELLNLSIEEAKGYNNWHINNQSKKRHFTHDNFELTILHQDYQQFQSDGQFDIIYYDPFGPNEAPELWTRELLSKSYSLLAKNGIWISFCAKGQVKRDLKSFKLVVQSPPGPPGKREITRAIKAK